MNRIGINEYYMNIEYKEFELIYKANQIVDELAYNKLNRKYYDIKNIGR